MRALIFSLASLYLVVSETIVLEPIQHKGEDISITIIQGARLSNTAYTELARTLQRQFTDYRLWVAIPKSFMSMPIGFLGNRAIYRAQYALNKKGFPKNARSYLAGHSLGGLTVSRYLVSNPGKYDGYILFGSYLERSSKASPSNSRVLTISGELDGLTRVTRITEEFYKRCYNKTTQTLRPSSNPVVIIKGMNHLQFSDGEQSMFVRMRDLKPEISGEEARNKTAQVVHSFITNNTQALNSFLQETLEFSLPIIRAYEMEGSIHFNRPNQTTCSRGFCGDGSNWVANVVQKYMSESNQLEKEGFNLEVENYYVQLSSLPPLKDLHHPKITVNNTKINMITYSQGSWRFLEDYLDLAFNPTSADEIGSKLISRQATYIKGANHTRNSTPDDIDTSNICSEINQLAFEWAVNQTSSRTLERYNKYGQKLVFKPDLVYTNGFSFTFTILKMNENKEGNIEVISPSMFTSVDVGPIPIFAPDGAGGFHYCKNLSPARAIEWIYVDSLRKQQP